ncbi:MerR family transcriptional regulator [Cellulomonas sp. JZ18]|uniref:MerR family transcriptional regulator n=1 Tax=Cellulomonas sp. JZ18 TaxID=2654191 RepID=UPI0018AFBD2E|nr:MerR family transcriptional regulator [Cellulomonas sp. JZ18]
MGAGWRTVDVARAAGVSAQAVRLYAGYGVLGEVPRAANGYRAWTARHADLAVAYRALAAAYGGETARRVLRAVHAGELRSAFTAVDAAHAAWHAERQRLDRLERALAELADDDPGDAGAVAAAASEAAGTTMTVGEVADALGVRTSALRVWEGAGLLRPARDARTGHRRYSDADVRDARAVQLLRSTGAPLEAIRPVLDALRAHADVATLRAAVDRRRDVLDAVARARVAAIAQLHRVLPPTA